MTTIELPDALAREAVELASELATTLQDLVVTGLRHEVERRTNRAASTDFSLPTAGGTGLLVEPGEAIRLSYGRMD